MGVPCGLTICKQGLRMIGKILLYRKRCVSLRDRSNMKIKYRYAVILGKKYSANSNQMGLSIQKYRHAKL